MIIRIIRIILRRIIFCDDGIGCQIKKQTTVLYTEILRQDIRQSIAFHDLSNDHKGSYPDTAAVLCSGFQFRQLHIPKIFQIVLIGNHHGRVCR